MAAITRYTRIMTGLTKEITKFTGKKKARRTYASINGNFLLIYFFTC